MAMSPEAQQLYDSIIAAGGTTQQAMAKVLRQFPREMMTALPAPSPGLLRGVAGATTGGGGFAPAAPRFTPAAPRFTPPPPRFAPGTTATTPAGAPPTPYAAPAVAMPRYPGSPAPSTGGSSMTPAEFASGVGLVGLAGLPVAYSTVPDRKGQVARRDAVDDADRRNDAQLAAIFAARNRQAIDDQDRANDARSFSAMESARRMQAIDDMDRRNAINPTNEDAPDSLDYIRGKLPPAQVQQPAQQAVNQARTMARPVQPAQSSPQEQGRVNALFNTIFSGKDYQSSGGQLLRGSPEGRRTVNWGDPDSAADFFRADAAAQRLRESGKDYRGASGSDIDYQNRMAANYGSIKDDVGPTGGKAGGGAVDNKPTKEALLHKSLEIIHHMLKTR